MNDGWIKVHRQLQNHWLWDDKPFSKGQAWIDLLMLANYKDNKTPYKGEIVTCARGDVNLSIAKLAERWGWGRKKVRMFLSVLERDHMIAVSATSHRTVITIENYSKYNIVCPADGIAEEQQGNSKGTAREQQGNTTKKEKKDKKDKKDKNISQNSRTDYDSIVQSFNEICKSYSSVRHLSDKRKRLIRDTLASYGMDNVLEAFSKSEASDFMKGNNSRKWKANFDWIMADANMAKILDGNFDNREKPNSVEPKSEDPNAEINAQLLEMFGGQ